MKKLLLFWLLVWLTSFSASAQSFQWAKIQGKETPAIATDGTNLFSAASFDNSITLGNQTFTNQGFDDSYLAKHNQFGTVLWAKHIIGAGNPISVEVDVFNNIIVSGIYIDSLYIDSLLFKNPIPSSQWGSTFTNIFVAKFNQSGSLLWARSSDILTGYNPNNLSISTDATGSIYISATYSNTITFNNTTINATGLEDVFLTKYDQNGNFQWINSSGNSDWDQLPIVKCGKNNDVYLIYSSHSGSGNNLKFTLKKYNTAGVQQWDKPVLNTHVYGISTDMAGNIYTAGTGDSTLTFGTKSLVLPKNQSQNHIFLAKITPAGTWKWAKEIVSGNYIAGGVKIGNEFNNTFRISGSISGNPTFGNTPFTTNNYERYIAKIDTAGNISNALTIKRTGVYLHYSDFDSGISTDLNGHTYLSGNFGGGMLPQNGNIMLDSIILNPGTSGPGAFPWQNTGYLTKVIDNSNSLTGTLFIDANGNGIKDTGEQPFENGMVELNTGSAYVSSSANGNYLMNLPTGNYNLQVIQPTNHYTFLPQNHSVSFAGIGQAQTKDFALVPIPNRNDVKVTVTNLTPARPGFKLKYRITFENVGTTTLSDSVNLQFNSGQLTFDSASIAPAAQQTGKLHWFYQNLQPTQKRNIDVNFTVDSTAPLNSQLTALATIKPISTDFIPGNNTDTLKHRVTGSYDPNDKQVSHSWLTPKQVTDGQLLDYVIRFQNTGNDTAFTVIVRDSISDKMHMPSFELLSASHPYTFKLLENGMAEWRFDNILLPDSGRNEAGSHGFIHYRMKPKSNLVLGDGIKSRAAIYFDFNAPVHTNYAVTRISLTNGIKEKNTNIQAFRLYPNPAKNYVMVEAAFKKNTSATVSLINLLGQSISQITLPENNQIHYQLPLNELPKGVYLIRLQTETGMQTQRLVIQ